MGLLVEKVPKVPGQGLEGSEGMPISVQLKSNTEEESCMPNTISRSSVMQLFEATCWLPKTKHKTILEQFFQR